MKRRLLWAALVLSSVVALGCQDDDSTDVPGGDTDAALDTNEVEADAENDTESPDATATTTIDDVIVVPNPSNVLSATVEWRTSQPSSSRLTLVCGDDYEQSWTLTERTAHSVFVMGLIAEQRCDLTLEAIDANGEVTDTFESEYFVDALPAFLPVHEVLVGETDAMEPGWTLLNLSNRPDDVPVIAALLDPQGRYRWYNQMPAEGAGGGVEVFAHDRGVVACGTGSAVTPTEIDWQGNVLWQLDVYMHHDCRFIDEEKQILRHLSESSDCPEGVRAASIVERDVTTGETLWNWSLCEHWLPDEIVHDWSHVNTIEPFPGENAILISTRNQHSLMKVDRDSGEVVWTLGLAGEFAMSDEDAFLRQHAPEIQPNGNIVLFDNGLTGTREYSRLIEIAYDETAMTAEVVWEYVPEPAIFAPIFGDADRLPNGNTLGTFGIRSEVEHAHIIEVDANANEVWHLRLPLKWDAYRADRVEPRFGHVIDL